MDNKRENEDFNICHNASNSVQYKDNAFMDNKKRHRETHYFPMALIFCGCTSVRRSIPVHYSC